MNVYIFGGSKSSYLKLQIEAIEKYCDAAAVYYLQGPLSDSPTMASGTDFNEQLPPELIDVRLLNTEVRPHMKSRRFVEIINYVMTEMDDGPSLFLHGDCVPFDHVGEGIAILDGKSMAAPKSFNLQWLLTTRTIAGRFLPMDDPDCTYYGLKSLSRKQWEASFSNVPFQLMQRYGPCFLHFDNYETDDFETIDNKIKAYELLR